jgi:hypothetical protein
MELTPEILAGAAGIALSLIFNYFPKLNVSFALLEEGQKKLAMLGMLTASSVAIFGLACLNWVDVGVMCTQNGALDMARILFFAIIGNQGINLISPKTKSVQMAKEHIRIIT